MEKKYKIKYNIMLAGFVLLIFIFNSEHINQQGTFHNIFFPIAQNILDNFHYSCNEFGRVSLFYPIWGYTILQLPDVLFSSGTFLISLMHFALTIITIRVFYKLFALEQRLWHILLFTPFVALMSVKWPDAIVGSLLLIHIYYLSKYISENKNKSLIIAGVLLGIIFNFRSEYLYFYPFLALIFLFPFKNIEKKVFYKAAAINFIIGIVFLLPWGIRAYIVEDDFRLTASNGGAVFYISLGQLPDNEWNIKPIDQTAYDIADSIGFDSPYSIEADRYFKKEVIDKISSNPGEFLKKCAYNFYSSLYRGVYTGEYSNFFIGKKQRIKIDEQIVKQGGTLNQIKYISGLEAKYSIPILIEKLIQAAFIPILIALLVIAVLKLVRIKTGIPKVLLIVICGLLVYKFLMISAIQYEYRHINSIYMFLLGIAFYKNRD